MLGQYETVQFKGDLLTYAPIIFQIIGNNAKALICFIIDCLTVWRPYHTRLRTPVASKHQ